MRETFGYRVDDFALAVDIVSEDTFKEVLEIVCQYLSRYLNITYWALLTRSVVNDEPGLQAIDSSTKNQFSYAIKSADGLYAGFPPYAFDNGKKLWVVSKDKQPHGPDKQLEDLWSSTDPKDLPRAGRSNQLGSKTSIVVPLHWERRRALGVLDLQMKEYHEPRDIATKELELLTNSLSRLLVLSEADQMRRNCTREALATLRSTLDQEHLPLLTAPQIFVASSKRADKAVMGTILSVLNSFENRLRIYHWAYSSESGNIDFEVLKQVKASRFGLCYFSEPVEDTGSELRFQDNANVVFEAGMFQSLTNPAATDAPTGWIPVRESPKLCPPPPFDFAQQRMIIVERIADNKPNLDTLQAHLKDRIETLLKNG
jgi:hypothetical protein